MKKLTVLTILSTALLTSGAAQADWNGNWLLGASGAYNWYNGSFDHQVDFNLPVNPPPSSFHNDLISKGWSWGLLGGYQVRYAQWLFGAELNVDWHQHDHTQNYVNTVDFGVNDLGTNLSVGFKRDATWGLTARLGYEVLPCFITYLRAGVERHHDKLDVVGDVDIPVPLDFAVDDSRHSYRFVGGIGVEAPIPYLAGLTFRTEYNYRPHGKSVDTSTNWNLIGVAVPAFSSVSARQHINTVKASLVYNFTI
ncbi:MAG: hypothetical protein BGO43_15110 [Gammaproteobacteria bacterium 39-13]|nr:hypothetical protein [Gammaproteobacteria bacterium]OJV87747.1 MAG: hypothetical protein BGO43_15110 [Gammaproteobacteria bacterium 39-13]